MSNIQKVGDGKYAIEFDAAQMRLRTYRNGEDWQEETGNKFLYCVWEELAKRQRQLQSLEYWKNEASQVFDTLDLPEISKLLNVPLGKSTAEHILPAIRNFKDLKGENVKLREELLCRSQFATRPILYTDTVNGEQCCRDDLWAITTEELNNLAKFKQERDELAAQVEVIRTALDALMVVESRGRFMPVGDTWDKARTARSITPSSALREIQARVLDDLEDELGEDQDLSNWFSARAAAIRKGE